MTAGPSGNALASQYDGLVCDLDGVVYRGGGAVVHAVESLLGCPAKVRVAYATNNASRVPADVAAQLRTYGLPAVPADVVTSAQAGARLLASRLPQGATVLAVGGPGVADALSNAGLRPVGRDGGGPGIQAVLQGYGSGVTAADLAEASYAVQGGALWVATNRDATLPTERGTAPGNGGLVSAVAAAVGREPVVVGKPQSPLYEACAERLSLPLNRILAIGDRLDTDILGAAAAGMDSLWVLTGVDSLVELVTGGTSASPTFVARDLRALSEPYEVPRLAGQWWACGAVRVRVSRDAEVTRVLETTVSQPGHASEETRKALLRAGVRALCEARDEGALPRDIVVRGAVELTSLAIDTPPGGSGQ